MMNIMILANFVRWKVDVKVDVDMEARTLLLLRRKSTNDPTQIILRIDQSEYIRMYLKN